MIKLIRYHHPPFVKHVLAPQNAFGIHLVNLQKVLGKDPYLIFVSHVSVKKYWKSVYNRCVSLIYTIWSQYLLRSHKIYWDLTRSTDLAKYIWHLTLTCHEMSFDMWHLQRSHKIYWFAIIHLTFGIWHLACHDIWHLTFEIWRLTFDIWHWYSMTFDIWHWYTMTFDIWHLTWLKELTALALILMILAQSYNMFTDGFCGYLSNRSLIVCQSVSQSVAIWILEMLAHLKMAHL